MFLLLFVGMYPLKSINNQLVEIIGACYIHGGIINNKAAVYSPYSSKSDELCLINNQVSRWMRVGGDAWLRQQMKHS